MRNYITWANNHIDAHLKGSFSDPWVGDNKLHSKAEMLEALNNGQTFSELFQLITTRYVSITSQLYSSALGYTTEAYRKAIRRGFKELQSSLING